MTDRGSEPNGGSEPSSLDRRQFLKLGAAVGGAAVAGKALGASRLGPEVAPSASGLKGSIRVRFWGVGPERQAWFNRIKYFNTQYPKIKVTKELLQLNGYQEFPALLTEIASGTAADVLRVLNYQPTQLVAQGKALLALDEFAAKDSKLDPGDFLPTPWKAAHVGKKLYALPQNGEPYVIYYNINAFKKAGIPTPYNLANKGKWNQDTLLSSAQALMKHGGMKFGVAFEEWNYDNLAFMGGGRILDASRKPVIDKAPTPKVLQYFADLVNVHKVAPSPSVPAGTYGTQFGNGQVGMYISGSWWGIDILQPIIGRKFKFAEVIMPEIFGHVGCKLEMDMLSLYEGSKDPQAAWDFASTVTNRRGEQIWMAAATPTRESVLKSKVYRSLSYASTVHEMVVHSTFTPFTTAGAAVDNICIQALSPMWLGQQKATAATQAAAAQLAIQVH